MTPDISQQVSRGAWDLVRRQHGVITLAQLFELGFTYEAVRQRVATGRLHRRYRGVYAVGRPELTRCGEWMAATLACGANAALSHASAAALWGIVPDRGEPIEVSLAGDRRPHGVEVHRRRSFEASRHEGIPVTTPICTIVDLAPRLSRKRFERMVGQADIDEVTNPEDLRRALDSMGRRPGVRVTRLRLDRRTFRLTRSELERILIPIALRAGLPMPLTRQVVNGFEVDFDWPDLRLIVESDGLRYHRTPGQQSVDRVRGNVHIAAGFTHLRFSDEQIAFEPEYVEATLRAVAERLIAG